MGCEGRESVGPGPGYEQGEGWRHGVSQARGRHAPGAGKED